METWALTYWEVVVRLLVAVVLGVALGTERTLAGKTAGMRTYALVSLGSALFVVTAQLVAAQYMEIGMRNFDPLRVASQVVVGVGFLGAGLILVKDEKLRGLTTAAGVWVASAIGLTAGFGLYPVAITATIFTMLIFTVFWPAQRFLKEQLDTKPPKPPVPPHPPIHEEAPILER